MFCMRWSHGGWESGGRSEEAGIPAEKAGSLRKKKLCVADIRVEGGVTFKKFF